MAKKTLLAGLAAAVLTGSAFGAGMFRASTTYSVSNQVTAITNTTSQPWYIMSILMSIPGNETNNLDVFKVRPGHPVYPTNFLMRVSATNVKSVADYPLGIFPIMPTDVILMTNDNQLIPITFELITGFYP